MMAIKSTGKIERGSRPRALSRLLARRGLALLPALMCMIGFALLGSMSNASPIGFASRIEKFSSPVLYNSGHEIELLSSLPFRPIRHFKASETGYNVVAEEPGERHGVI